MKLLQIEEHFDPKFNEHIVGPAQTGSRGTYLVYGEVKTGETRKLGPGKGHEEIVFIVKGGGLLRQGETETVMEAGQAVYAGPDFSGQLEGTAPEGIIYVSAGDTSLEVTATEEKAKDRGEVKKPAVVLFAVAVCIAAGFLMLDILLESGTRLALEGMADRCRELGVDVTGADFEEVTADLPLGVRWEKCVVSIAPADGDEAAVRRAGAIRIDEVRLRPESILDLSFVLEARGIEASLGSWNGGDRTGDPVRNMVVDGEKARLAFRVTTIRPGALVAELEGALTELEKLLTEGESALPVTFSGSASFFVRQKPFEARIRVINGPEGSFLVMDETDIIAVSQEFNLKKPLTKAEVRLLSGNPLKAPRLFEIRSYARRVSREEDRKDRAVPEDAFRHVLWSYLLTREYGPEFAKKVTDAHEEGMTGNTESERRMDLQNNSRGRDYARRSYPETKILRLVMSDPQVVRSAD